MKKAKVKRVYTYGCLAPLDGAEALHDDLRRHRRYYNMLVEIRRASIAAYREVRRPFAHDLDRLEQECVPIDEEMDAIRTEIKRRRKATVGATLRMEKGKSKDAQPRPKRTHFPDLEAKLKDLKERLAPIKVALTEERKRFTEPVTAGREEFRRRVEERCKAVGKTAKMKKANTIGPNDPRLQRFKDEVQAEMFGEPQWSDAWRAVAGMDDRVKRMKKAARVASGIPHGTYTAAEDAAKRAAKTTDSHDGPSFKRHDGGGCVRVQIQKDKGMTPAKLLGGTSSSLRLTLTPLPTSCVCKRPHPGHDCLKSKSAARRPRRGTVQIRVGVEAKMVTLPVLMHRALPEAARIKWAWIHVKRIGERLVYRLQLSLELEAASVRRPDRAGSGAVALHLGWRKTEAGLRVGYLVGSDGFHREVVLRDEPDRIHGQKAVPYGVAPRLGYAVGLRTASDTHFNEVRDALASWIGGGGLVPAWAQEELRTMAQWNAHWRLARVARRWISEAMTHEQLKELWGAWKRLRLPNDLDLFAYRESIDAWAKDNGIVDEATRVAVYLEWWRRKDSHLETFRQRTTLKAVAFRKQCYRQIAIEMSRKYGTLVVENTDLRLMVRRAPAEGDDKLHQAARQQRQTAAPGELRATFEQVFGGGDKVDPAGCGDWCHECGERVDNSDRDALDVRCAGGHLVDRDLNLATNMLRSWWRERFGDDKPMGGARKKENVNENKAITDTKKAVPGAAGTRRPGLTGDRSRRAS